MSDENEQNLADALVNDLAGTSDSGEDAGDDQAALADEWAAAMGEQADLDELSSEAGGAPPELDVILDIPVSISMEVGRTNIPIRNLLQLNQGSVIELDRFAGEPLDVLVNGTLIAQGEVVMVNEKFGIRLTDVLSPAERINKLK